MAVYTTIDDPSAHFHIQLYTGDGNTNRDITNDANAGDFQPDMLWIKTRSRGDSNHHLWYSSVSMPNHLSPDQNFVEATATNKATALNADGFRIQNHSSVNTNTDTYVAWQWKMNGGSTTSGGGTDSAGTSTHQANTTAGQSIVTYTGTGSVMTVAHGLGAVPAAIFIKKRTDDTENWRVYHKEGYHGGSYGQQQSGGQLNEDNAFDHGANSYWNNTSFTSTLFTVKDNSTVNDNTDTYVAYCFAEIQGYSKFGGYKGNANADGPFIYLGFKPKYFLLKSTDIVQNWYVFDSARDAYNPSNSAMQVSGTAAQETGYAMDFLSNGFKIRHADGAWNGNGNTYIYMAFAEQPLVTSTGIPCTAR